MPKIFLFVILHFISYTISFLSGLFFSLSYSRFASSLASLFRRTPIWYRHVLYNQDIDTVRLCDEEEGVVAVDCHGHSMKISTYGDEDSYSTGFICDRCGQHGEYQQERWFCLECRADICFDCISTKGVNVQSKKGLKMQWQWSSDNQHWMGW